MKGRGEGGLRATKNFGLVAKNVLKNKNKINKKSKNQKTCWQLG